MARTWAQNSHCIRKKVGVFIVKDNTIISDGFNGTPKGMDNSCEDENGETRWYVIHSEQNAILKLAQSTVSSTGSTMYITLSPCRECCKMILGAGISRLVYDKQHSDTSGLDILRYAGVEVMQLDLDEIEKLTTK